MQKDPIYFNKLQNRLGDRVGQSYDDGAENMRGQFFSGLKTRILEHAKLAVYVWCSPLEFGDRVDYLSAVLLWSAP